jgi:catechol 2,3-dioxygenase-like lactoylglutathione lyase family enzyme
MWLLPGVFHSPALAETPVEPAKPSVSQDTCALTAAVDSIGIMVADMDRALDFYTRVLSFEIISDKDIREASPRPAGLNRSQMRVARLRLGDEFITLTRFTPAGRPIPADSRSNDRWFQHIAIITNDMDRAFAHLQQQGVQPVSPAPQRLPDWNPAAGGIRAYYFQDPERHVLEVLQFPAGKGNPKWHQPSAGRKLFLGIDHTAIVVGDTETSLRFYRDLLEMQVAGESTNYGPEQELLSNVPGARLRITTLRAARGPGIELLEYLSPRDGRTAPHDLRANDLIHWRTHLITGNVPGSVARLKAANIEVLPLQQSEDEDWTRLHGLRIQDPDGHALLLGP